MVVKKEKISWGQDFCERVLQYFQSKQIAKMKEADLNRKYYDIGRVLWYDVAYGNVLKYKREKMDVQNEPFFNYTIGNKTFTYGPIMALTLEEDRKIFAREAEAEIRDLFKVKCKVTAYNDCVVVEF